MIKKIYSYFLSLSLSKKLGYLLFVISVLVFLQYAIRKIFTGTSNTSLFGNILKPRMTVRNDDLGGGHFGDSRGSRTHAGVDIECYKGQPVYAPFSGTITREIQAYPSTTKYRGIEIVSDSGAYKSQILYCELDFTLLNTQVNKGQRIGTCQAISEHYDSRMQDHLHVELYEGGVKIDPELKFKIYE